MALGVTDLRKGQVFAFEGHPYRVTEYSQKVVGRGGSIVNVTIKSLLDGRVLQKTFKGNEQLDSVDLSYSNVQYLYNDGAKFYFMDNESYEQIELIKTSQESSNESLGETSEMRDNKIYDRDMRNNMLTPQLDIAFNTSNIRRTITISSPMSDREA